MSTDPTAAPRPLPKRPNLRHLKDEAKDLLKAGALSLPLTLVILLLVFGAVVAAGIPLLLALTSVLATIGLLSLPSHLLPMDDAVSADDIDDTRARRQLEEAQAELERVERGESDADRWQLEQRIRHAENQLTVSGR